MARYHINPETGQVSICRAKTQCRFMLAQEHYVSAEEARHAFEKIMEGEKPLSWLLTSPKTVITGPQEALSFTKKQHEKYLLMKEKMSESESCSLQNYTQFGFEYVNAHLRHKPLPTRAFSEEDAIKHAEKLISDLDSIFTHEKLEPKTVYRYVKVPAQYTVEQFLQKFEDEKTYTDPAYMSTSASIDLPLQEFLENDKEKLVLLEIATTRGISLQSKPEPRPGWIQSVENEVLLPRNMKFTVASTTLKQKTAFGGMKNILQKHVETHSRKLRKWLDKDVHRTPIIRLVQQD